MIGVQHVHVIITRIVNFPLCGVLLLRFFLEVCAALNCIVYNYIIYIGCMLSIVIIMISLH